MYTKTWLCVVLSSYNFKDITLPKFEKHVRSTHESSKYVYVELNLIILNNFLLRRKRKCTYDSICK